ncbi:MAG: porin family protein, partial [Alphaproteobacteria bacterium]|nr:porin family protein [Alphaproteobacteria bacterium]
TSYALAAEKGSDKSLAKASQNPIASLISVPIQYDVSFGQGPSNRTGHILQFQPVYPFRLGKDWNLITRTIVPLVVRPDFPGETGHTFGLGDISTTLFFSPSKPTAGGVIWGVGPVFQFPTATSRVLGTEHFAMGPSAVIVWTPGRWVVGALVAQTWSVAGDKDRNDVSFMLIQPFVNYNLDKGWFLTTSPVITANWDAKSSNRWTVPIGGGVGRVFRFVKQPVSLFARAFYYPVAPSNGPEWSFQVQLKFLFPK